MGFEDIFSSLLDDLTPVDSFAASLVPDSTLGAAVNTTVTLPADSTGIDWGNVTSNAGDTPVVDQFGDPNATSSTDSSGVWDSSQPPPPDPNQSQPPPPDPNQSQPSPIDNTSGAQGMGDRGTGIDSTAPGGISTTTQTGGVTGMVNGALDWFKQLPPGAQNILLGGAVGLAKGALGGQSKNKTDAAQEKLNEQIQAERTREYNQNRQDVLTRSQIPALIHGAANPAPATPPPQGIVNNGTTGP